MRRRKITSTLILALIAMCSAGPGWPQTGSPSGNGVQVDRGQGDYTVKVDVNTVFLNVSVRDGTSNRSIPGLQKEDFIVYEDRIQQKITQFQPTEAPFKLLLLLDVSGSTESYLGMMKRAAMNFTHQINSSDSIAVATFNSSVQLVQDFTNDRDKAEHAINRIRSSGGTSLYDALMTCLNRYMKNIEGRTAIVVFTDGVDNQLEGKGGSRVTYNDLYRRVQETETIIYTIFLNTEEWAESNTRNSRSNPGVIGGWPGSRRGGGIWGGLPIPIPSPFPTPQPSPIPSPYPPRQRDERAIYEEAQDQLTEIAEQTGGRMYSPRRAEELSEVYSQIAEDLRVQYQLGYNSSNSANDGEWREIEVKLFDRRNAIIRTRKGYYPRNDS